MTSQKKPKKDSLCSRSSLFLLFLQRLGKENTMLPAYLQNQQQQPQNQPSPPPRITQQTQAPNPVHYPQLFQDSHVPPHLLQRSPLNANVPIAWNHSAYTSDPSIVRVPLQVREKHTTHTHHKNKTKLKKQFNEQNKTKQNKTKQTHEHKQMHENNQKKKKRKKKKKKKKKK